MRIRKRFPMSSMAPPVSDPPLNHSTSVQQSSSTLHPIQNMAADSRPSDPPARPLSSDQKPVMHSNTLHPNKFEIKHQEEEEEENGSNNNSRKEYNFLGVETVGETRVLPSLSSHPAVEGRWDDGDEKIPLKKRKGAVEEEETVLKIKSKTNKKCSTSGMQQNQVKAGTDESNSTLNENVVKKMNKRGGAIMEGSRCSRVNGRGWRCCQQTLVGYSLCEHHLGKGRLRSISNVKGRKTPASAATIAPQNVTTHGSINDITSNANTTDDNESSKKVLDSLPVVQSPRPRDRKNTILLDGSCYDEEEEEDKDEDDDDDDDYNEEETKKPVVAKKKRMKVGMVKARSLSSLLNGTN